MGLVCEAASSIRPTVKRVASNVHLVVITLVIFACAIASPVTFASQLDKVIHFDIQAESLDKALLQFGAQAHVQISFAWNLSTARMQTRKVKGNYTAREALMELLKGTRLSYVAHDQTVEILPSPTSESEPLDPPGKQPHINQAVTSRAPRRQKPDKRTLAEVVITGSRIPTTEREGPQEVKIYGLEQIDQSGQNSIGNFLSTLPYASVLAGNETDAGQQSTIRLRGLPAGTTLVLLNGRRVEGSGFSGGNFFNLDDLPLAAVQRIEVVPNGSSAIYGADAIAGVVNIILREDFNGFAANAKYGSSKDFSTVRTSVALGRQWNRGGISAVASFGVDGGLLHSQRRLTASNDYRAFGGANSNYPDCFPGNVFSTNGKPLPGGPPGSSASYATVSGSTLSGKPAFSDFTYGALNECSSTAGESILPPTHHAGVLIEGHLNVAPNIELFTEVIYTVNNVDIKEPPPLLYGTLTFQSYRVPASNPFNPFGEAVGVGMSIPGIETANYFNTDFFRPLLGVRGTLAGRWDWELSAWQSTDWTQSVGEHEEPNRSAILSALSSSNPATALNVFVNGPVASQSVLGPLYANEDIKFMGRDRSAEAFIRGPILRLPAGDVTAVIGGDSFQSTLDQNDIYTGTLYPPNFRQTHKRRYDATFGEARIPVIGNVGHVRTHLLTLTVAGRHDHYSDFGSANTSQFGVEIRPMASLLLRGTYADAFKAPTLANLYAGNTSYQSAVRDPATGALNEPTVTVGGNPHLQPMTGRSHTAGVMYSSQTISGLLVSATQWDVVQNSVIQSVAPQVIVTNSAFFPGRVIRNAGGQIIAVNGTQVNFGTFDVGGLDYDLRYQHSVGGGTWSMNLDATDIYHYRQALVPGAVPLESVGKGEDDSDWAPRWMATVGMGLQEGEVDAHFEGRYTGSYQDYDSARRRIGNFWIFNANARWAVGRSHGETNPWLRGSYIEIGATDLFNRAPQYSNYLFDLVGYDPSEMSIVGRTLYLSLGFRW